MRRHGPLLVWSACSPNVKVQGRLSWDLRPYRNGDRSRTMEGRSKRGAPMVTKRIVIGVDEHLSHHATCPMVVLAARPEAKP